MNVLVTHIPHAVPVVAIWVILLRYWLAQRRLGRDGNETAAGAPSPRLAAPVGRPVPAAGLGVQVRRSVALRGLLALGPLVGALATGLVIYALNLGRGRAGDAAIWTHVGLSLLGLLLVAYKISDIGMARLRQSLRGAHAWRGVGSLVLLALWVPLLASGVALLLAPSEASFTAYVHLIASVWWTGLFLWHLRRYLVRATRAVLARPATRAGPATRPASALRAPGRPSLAPLRGDRPTPRASGTPRPRSGSAATERPHRNSPGGEQESSPAARDGATPAPSRGR